MKDKTRFASENKLKNVLNNPLLDKLAEVDKEIDKEVVPFKEHEYTKHKKIDILNNIAVVAPVKKQSNNKKVTPKANFCIEEAYESRDSAGFISDYYICQKELINTSFMNPIKKQNRTEPINVIDKFNAHTKRIKCTVVGTKYNMKSIIDSLPSCLKLLKFSQQKNVTILCLSNNNNKLDDQKFVFVFDYGVSITWE